MKLFYRKLHSSKGATMLMALALLLVATAVSVVIVSAAVSNATTVRSTRIQEQQLLTVSSAAELMRNSITKAEITVTNTYEKKNEAMNWSLIRQQFVCTDVFFGESILSAIEEMEKSGATVGAVRKIFSITAAENGYQEVQMKLLIERNGEKDSYDLTALFSCGETSMIFVMSGTRTVASSTSENDTLKTDTITVKWVPVEIKRPNSKELSIFNEETMQPTGGNLN